MRTSLLMCIWALITMSVSYADAPATSSAPTPVTCQPLQCDVKVAATPLPWAHSAEMSGELLVDEQLLSSPQSLAGQSWVASDFGVLRLSPGQPARILPSLLGHRMRLIGEYAGRVWVQELQGPVFALDPSTGGVEQRFPTVQGQCFAIGVEGFWCLDTFEPFLSHGFHGENADAHAVIAYNPEGKERLRLPADGTALPNGRLLWAGVDAECLWVIDSCEGQAHGGPQICRISRASGKVDSFPVSRNVKFPLLLNAHNLIWLESHDNVKYSTICKLDKQTGMSSTVGKIFEEYTWGKLGVSDQYLWCFPNQNYQQKTPRETAVFSLEDGHRVHVAESGTPPSPISPPQQDSLLDQIPTLSPAGR